jgi:hypothetical protein
MTRLVYQIFWFLPFIFVSLVNAQVIDLETEYAVHATDSFLIEDDDIVIQAR